MLGMQQRTGRDGTFSETRTSLAHTSRIVVWLLVLGGGTLIAAWFLFVSGYWTITDVQTNDLKYLDRGEVQSAVYDALDHGSWKPWDRRNIFFAHKKRLAEELKERLFAEEVSVDKTYPNVLRLLISERQRSVVVASNNQLLLVDMNGLVTSVAADDVSKIARTQLASQAVADKTHLPLIQLDLHEPAADGYQVTDTDTMRMWIEAYNDLLAQKVSFRYISLGYATSQMAVIRSAQGVDILVDLGTPLKPQVETYQKFIKSKQQPVIPKEYIDVRIPGKVFVK